MPKRLAQPFDRDAQMHFALPPQDVFVGLGVVHDRERGSSSTSLLSAWPSLTSSLRSFAAIANASTGG